MRHKMGGGRASYSRKNNLILLMRLRRVHLGMSLAEACESTRRFARYKLADLAEVSRAERKSELAGTLTREELT